MEQDVDARVRTGTRNYLDTATVRDLNGASEPHLAHVSLSSGDTRGRVDDLVSNYSALVSVS